MSYIDAILEDTDDMKPTSGYIFILVGGAIYWKSITQTIMTSSTIHVSFLESHEATSQVMRRRNFIMGIKVNDSIYAP